LHRHRDGIAAGFAERLGVDPDDFDIEYPTLFRVFILGARCLALDVPFGDRYGLGQRNPGLVDRPGIVFLSIAGGVRVRDGARGSNDSGEDGQLDTGAHDVLRMSAGLRKEGGTGADLVVTEVDVAQPCGAERLSGRCLTRD